MVPRRQFPVGFSMAAWNPTKSDLRSGRIHCLLWSAPGCGWEHAPPGSAPELLSIDGLCSILQTLPPRSRPPVIFVVMEYGAKRAAAQITRAIAEGQQEEGVPLTV